MNRLIIFHTTARYGRRGWYGVWENKSGDRLRNIYIFRRHD